MLEEDPSINKNVVYILARRRVEERHMGLSLNLQGESGNITNLEAPVLRLTNP